MNDYPILFSGEMVRAILEGRKTQTRRVMKPQPSADFSPITVEWYAPTVEGRDGEEQPGTEIFGVYGDEEGYRCPYGAPGDRLWVRETWLLDGNVYLYKANFGKGVLSDSWQGHWKPSIHMPRVASRITLEIVKVRVERVKDITRSDAILEGVSNVWSWDAGRNAEHPEHFSRALLNPYVANYSVLWDKINAARGLGWDVNPWVWVIEFKQVTP